LRRVVILGSTLISDGERVWPSCVGNAEIIA
jgi:hypothetical protein